MLCIGIGNTNVICVVCCWFCWRKLLDNWWVCVLFCGGICVSMIRLCWWLNWLIWLCILNFSAVEFFVCLCRKCASVLWWWVSVFCLICLIRIVVLVIFSSVGVRWDDCQFVFVYVVCW